MLKKVGLLLVGTILVLGLSFSPVEAAEITIGGGMDTNFDGVSGIEPKEGKESIWEHKTLSQKNLGRLLKWQIATTHIHQKTGIDVSDKVSGEIYVCLTHNDYMGCLHANLITAFVDYELFSAGMFGGDNLNLRVGRFLIPFGYFNSIAINPVNLQSVSRPLMIVDHDQYYMETHGGPKPIFHTPFSDIGAELFGTKWLRGEKDQLWFGIYLVNGMYEEKGIRVDVEWNPMPRPKRDTNASKSFGGQISYSVGDLLTVGASYQSGKYDDKDKLWYTIYGGDVHLALGKANLRFEYYENPIEWIPKTASKDLNTLLGTQGEYTKGEYTKSGWYTQLDFPFGLVFGETDLAKKFEFSTMYSYLEKKPADNIEEISRFSVGVNFAPEPALKFRLEYQLTMLGDMKSTGDIATYGEDFDNLNRVNLSVGLAF